jgi:hypothetical protein
VLDLQGDLVGIVTEADFLRHSEAGTERQRPPLEAGNVLGGHNERLPLASSVMVPHSSTTPLCTIGLISANGAHGCLPNSAKSCARMASPLCVPGFASRATLARV